MSFYVRKSLRAGPFRFSLSGSGLGVSAGVPGFRIGTGPRGNYVNLGARGIYYRASQGRGSVVVPNANGNRPSYDRYAQSWHPSSVPLEDITGATVSELQPSGKDEIVAELNRAASRIGLGWPVLIAAFVLGLVFMPWGFIVWLLAIPLCWWLFLRDASVKSVVVFYDVNDESAVRFERLVQTLSSLTNSQRIWRLAAAGAVQTPYQHKTNAGASQIVSRQQAKAHLVGPKRLVTNVAVPTIESGKTSLHFLPDRLLVRDGKQFADVAYENLFIQFGTTRFIESEGSIPTDAQWVGETWQYVNVKGGPDRRFKNNRRLPIMLYGEARISSGSGLRWEIQTSSVPLLEALSISIGERKALALPTLDG